MPYYTPTFFLCLLLKSYIVLHQIFLHNAHFFGQTDFFFSFLELVYGSEQLEQNITRKGPWIWWHRIPTNGRSTQYFYWIDCLLGKVLLNSSDDTPPDTQEVSLLVWKTRRSRPGEGRWQWRRHRKLNYNDRRESKKIINLCWGHPAADRKALEERLLCKLYAESEVRLSTEIVAKSEASCT